MTYKSLIVLAAVACLPIACGTNPTGADVSAVGAEGTVSALRGRAPLPPYYPVPPPPPVPSPAPGPAYTCQATSVLIKNLTSFAPSGGVALEARLMDRRGDSIVDSSCERMVWTVSRPGTFRPVVIAYNQDSRFVSVSGMSAGSWTVAARTPNGARGTLVIDVVATTK